MTVSEILAQLPKLSAMVVGDICLDRWCAYDPSEAEPSRETGIPRVGVISTSVTPGAGGTVAHNLAAMGLAPLLEPSSRKAGGAPDYSTDRFDHKLLADLARQAVIDLRVARHGRLRAISRISVDRVAAAFALQTATLALQVIDKFVPLHPRGAPT